ncbi:MAG TPA: hypothetical protein VJ506_05530, partial [Candidatus Limnocylindrales bacterium]|nr:hypothetical protein [Candidatus Limnocylindrales bacterium]
MDDRGSNRRDSRLLVVLATVAVVLLVTVGADGRLPQGVPASMLTSSADPSTALADASGAAAPRQALAPAATPAPSGTPAPSVTPAPTGTPAPARTSAPSRSPAATRKPTATATPRPTSAPAPCRLFPSDNVWNTRIDSLPVAGNSAAMLAAIGLAAYLHPDFSSLAWNGGKGYGIPFNKVNLSTPRYTFAFTYADESDPGPYPVPS